MAEARVEDEEESLRETREAGGGPRRNPRPHSAASGRADRNKPEQRQSSSQGALSSIRAVIKRTSTRTTAPTNPIRERRRPEITILAAEPLATSSWGVFPPPPPPAQLSWTAPVTVELPPPSYDQVIREKSREQNIFASSVSSSSSSSSPSSSLSSSSSSSAAAPRHTATISTQTEPEVPEPPSCTRPLMRRPPKPPRPSLPPAPKPAEPVLAHIHSLIELDEPDPCCSTHTPAHHPSGQQCGVQTDVTPTLEPLIPISHDSSHITQNSQSQAPLTQEGSRRPRPRPRSKASLQAVISEESQDQPITREVKVQTLVRLKDDSGASVFAGFTDSSLDTASNKYLQDLLEVFGCGLPDIQSHQHDESDHSTKSDEEEDLECCSVSTFAAEPSETITRPEPRPRTQKPKPPVAAKPSDLTQSVEKTKPPADEQNQPASHPVPAPRPLVKQSHMLQRQGSSEEKADPCCPQRPPLRPLLAALKSGASTREDGAGVRFNPSERSSSGDQHQTAAAFGKPVAMTSSGRGGQCPAKPPSHRRPPPPTHTPAQDTVSSAGVTKSGPSLPHRAGEARLLPLRPPPIKTSKPAGSSQTPAATNQHPGGSRGAKRGPPLPPRPKPGHALFREGATKSPGGDLEESYLQKQKLLVALDEPPGDVKGRRRSSVSEDPVSQKRPELKLEPRTEERRSETTTGVRYRAQLAFSGEDGELTFSDGDVIALIGYVNEEWGRGRLNGATGNFPLNFVQLVQESPAKNLTAESSGDGQTGRALYDFTPESEDELRLKVGDLVSSLEEVDEEWFVGEFAGRRGIVPKNHIHVL